MCFGGRRSRGFSGDGADDLRTRGRAYAEEFAFPGTVRASQKHAGRLAGWRFRVHGEFPNRAKTHGLPSLGTIAAVRDFPVLLVHLIVTLIKLAKPGGLRTVLAESVLVRDQLLILNRGRKRAPSLRPADRIVGFVHACYPSRTSSPVCHRSEAFHTVASA
jgi:hypothetical protein